MCTPDCERRVSTPAILSRNAGSFAHLEITHMHHLYDDHRSHLAPATTAATGRPSPEIEPVIVADWWCTSCGHGEADEHTRLCDDCTYMGADGHARLAGPLAAGPQMEGLDHAIARVEEAQGELVAMQLETERLLDRVEGGLYAALSATAEAMHRLGSTLLLTHTVLSYARLATPAEAG
jgi:hypothetical protein